MHDACHAKSGEKVAFDGRDVVGDATRFGQLRDRATEHRYPVDKLVMAAPLN